MEKRNEAFNKSVFGRKRWTDKENKILIGLNTLGYNPYQISEALIKRSKKDPEVYPRTQAAVMTRISKLNLNKPKISDINLKTEITTGKPVISPGLCAITEDVSIGTVTGPKLQELDVPVYNDTEVSISQSDNRQFFDKTAEYTIDGKPNLFKRLKNFLNRIFGAG